MKLPNRLKTPSFIQKFQWIADPVKYMRKAAEQYPNIFTAEVVGFGDTVVFVNHPQAIQEILSNDVSSATLNTKPKKFAAPSELNIILKPLLGDKSLFMLDGDDHKRRRQLIMPSFHGERMRSYGQLISNIAEKVFSQLPINQPFLALNATQEISLQVILEAVFGLYEGERCQQLKHLFPVFISNVFRSPLASSLLLFSFLQKDFGAWSPWGKFLRDRSEIDKLLYAEIAERRSSPDLDRTDILSLLMSSQDEAGNSMTDQELRDQMVTLTLAGYETTATAMAWALYWIHQNPEIREKLVQELDTLGDSPDPMSIFRLPYLTAVCNETLRIHPMTMLTLPRVVQESVELLGHTLEPGTVIQGCIYLTHRREDLYPEPEKFKPERFLERQFSPYEFMPFGAGARSCIGQALAMFEMKLALAKIMSSYQLALVDRLPEKPQRRGVTLGPGNGVKMIITGQRARQESTATTAATATL